MPRYEDRMVSETVKYQILAAGGLIASSVSEADLIVMINTPSGNPLEHLTTEPLPARIEYDANRNQIEQVEYAAYAIDTLKKPVCFADVAYANGGDPELYALLREKGLCGKLPAIPAGIPRRIPWGSPFRVQCCTCFMATGRDIRIFSPRAMLRTSAI